MESSMRDKLDSCLSQQLAELEVLKSMYPNDDEIHMTDPHTLQDIQDFIDKKTEYTPNHLDFTLNLHLDGRKLEVSINLPSLYPEDEPEIYIRCNQLNRLQETTLNLQLSNVVKTNHLGEVCLYTIISWLQDSIEDLIGTDHKTIEPKAIQSNKEEKPEEKFVRIWIHSHHIYNKRKREEIVKKAKELGINGFCLPGKPGIICIEGANDDCTQWWKEIKSMCWKKIVIRKTEEFEPLEREKEQKFDKFEEISFPNSSSKTSKHADMSCFSRFMEEHGLSQTFHDFFGLCKVDLKD